MKSYSILCIFIIINIFQFNSFAQWVLVNNGLPYWNQASSLDALDSNFAIIATESGLFKTLDGGGNWVNIDSTHAISDVSVASFNNIWIATIDAKIYHSPDAGINWTEQFNEPALTNFLNYIDMFDSSNGIAMGDATNYQTPVIILKTTDGGNNWIPVNNSNVGSHSGDYWRRIDFLNMETGYFFISGYNSSVDLMKTTTGGSEWFRTNLNRSVGTIKFYDENYGIVHVKYPTVQLALTTDGGNSYRFYDSPDGNISLQDIEFIPGSKEKIWHAGHDNLFFSSDSGKTWVLQEIVDNLECIDMKITDESSGWLLCRDGRIYHSKKADQVVSVEDLNNRDLKFELYTNYPNPFNSSTNIKYSVPKQMRITVKVYDILGSEILTLEDSHKSAGLYQLTLNADNFPSGIYFYQMRAEEFVSTKKMMLLK
jgi:photosystem II stability/assembly factor-like uncharacterized protein